MYAVCVHIRCSQFTVAQCGHGEAVYSQTVTGANEGINIIHFTTSKLIDKKISQFLHVFLNNHVPPTLPSFYIFMLPSLTPHCRCRPLLHLHRMLRSVCDLPPPNLPPHFSMHFGRSRFRGPSPSPLFLTPFPPAAARRRHHRRRRPTASFAPPPPEPCLPPRRPAGPRMPRVRDTEEEDPQGTETIEAETEEEARPRARARPVRETKDGVQHTRERGSDRHGGGGAAARASAQTEP
jgi:hypothetical protein